VDPYKISVEMTWTEASAVYQIEGQFVPGSVFGDVEIQDFNLTNPLTVSFGMTNLKMSFLIQADFLKNAIDLSVLMKSPFCIGRVITSSHLQYLGVEWDKLDAPVFVGADDNAKKMAKVMNKAQEMANIT